MTLQEKFENVGIVYDKELNLVKNNVQIADDFAIGFLEWGFNNYNIIKGYDLKLLLIKYKKEQEL